MSNKLDYDDKVAANRYAEGYVLEWDLALREWRREMRRKHGRPPLRGEEDVFFSKVSHLNKWVVDPEFGQSIELRESDIGEIRQSLGGMPQLARQFERFLRKHTGAY